MRITRVITFLLIMVSLVLIACTSTPVETLTDYNFSTNLNVTVYPPDAGVVSAMVAPSKAGVISDDYINEMMVIVPPEGKAYERETPLMLKATPNEGFTFAYWGGDRFSYWQSSVSRQVSLPETWWLVMNYHKTIIAQFTEISSPISEVTVSAVTESTANIGWATPEGYSRIEYGLSEAYGKIVNQHEDAHYKGHTYKLSKLEPESFYHLEDSI